MTARCCMYCGEMDDTHDPAKCEEEARQAELARLQTYGPCPYHDYALPFNCQCPPLRVPGSEDA